MKTTLDKSIRAELTARIQLLTESSSAHWGKMNVIQMMKHCILWEEMVLHNLTHKRVFIGRIFGKMALRNIVKDAKDLKRETPTIPAFIIAEKNGDLTHEKTRWISLVEQYGHFANDHFIHPFFGKMTRAQIGIMAYKHIDHHLRQFGV